MAAWAEVGENTQRAYSIPRVQVGVIKAVVEEDEELVFVVVLVIDVEEVTLVLVVLEEV